MVLLQRDPPRWGVVKMGMKPVFYTKYQIKVQKHTCLKGTARQAS